MDSSNVQTPSQKIVETFRQVSESLTASGLSTRDYMIPDFTGYSSVTGTETTDVYCLESLLGPTHNHPGYLSYAVAQVFHPQYPNMALVLMISRNDQDGTLDSIQPAYNPRLDKPFSRVFLRLMQTAFNSLDVTGQGKGVLVQSYNARVTLSDVPHATIASIQILLRLKKSGQLASIAVDFDDSFMILVDKLLLPLSIIGDIHSVPRSPQISSVQIPVKDRDENVLTINNSSTALDKGFEIAIKYLENHYHKTHPILQARGT